MKKKSKKNLKIFPIGGIGNQLFIYFAGRHLADKLERELRIDLSLASKFGTKHRGDISSFHLPGTFLSRKSLTTSHGYFSRIDKRLIRRVSIYRKIKLVIFRYFNSPELGYNKEMETLKRVRSIHGYFQTWKYYEFYKESHKDFFRIQSHSRWYSETLASLEKIKPIALHIRRGDYNDLKEEFGILSNEYYSISLEIMKKHFGEKEVWVFSDDIPAAKTILNSIDGHKFSYIIPPKESAPIESMMLMSRCPAIIIANSTFSYWAGLIQSDDKLVIAPTKWFRGRIDPRDLIPPSWERVESTWEE